MEITGFKGWKNNVRLTNGEIELIITKDVGPRVIRFGFIGGKNLFAEIAGQQGGTGEKKWMIRGGHRLWIAPENKKKTYELDNVPVKIEEIKGGVRTIQPPGPAMHVGKIMEITLASNKNEAVVKHVLVNDGNSPVKLAVWALSVMSAGGKAIIPLPKKISHTERLLHNQEWSIWGYTDFGDPRWTLGSRYILFRQDPKRGPNKLGITHREGWVSYLLKEFLFVKKFAFKEGAEYPDGGVNFETFSNEDFLELESLGPLVTLAPGKSVSHEERWSLHRGVSSCNKEADVDANIIPLI